MSTDENDVWRDEEANHWFDQFQQSLPEILRDGAADIAFTYLRANGDAVQRRVDRAISDARYLNDQQHHEAAVVRAFSAIEVIIGHLLLRPLLPGVVLVPGLADRLVQEVIAGQHRHEKALILPLLRHWKIDLASISLPDGRLLWPLLNGRLREKRNQVVHQADECSSADASATISVATLLLEQVVEPLARSFGFTRAETGSWADIQKHMRIESAERHDPFSPAKAI